MQYLPAKLPMIALACLLTTGCSGMSGTWPDLAEPLPDPAERRLVTADAAGTSGEDFPATSHGIPKPGPDATDDAAPKSESEAADLLSSIRDAIGTEQKAYKASLAAFSAATDDDRLDAWFEAQATLTRLSRTSSRLDALLYSDFSAPAEKAAKAYAEIEDYVVAERQWLGRVKPQ